MCKISKKGGGFVGCSIGVSSVFFYVLVRFLGFSEICLVVFYWGFWEVLGSSSLLAFFCCICLKG